MTRKASLCFWTALISIFVSMLAYRFSVYLNHDVAWLLMGAEKMAGGAVFGRDVIDVNPPLPWWIDQPAIWMHKLGLRLSGAFTTLVAGLAGLSLYLSAKLLSETELNKAQRGAVIVGIAFVVLLCSGYNFGQREHLMTVLVVPFIILTALRAKGWTGSTGLVICVAVLAGFGLFQKPFFLTVPIALELWLQLRRFNLMRLFRLEMLVLLFGGLAYVACVLIFARPYIFELLPQILSNYTAYNYPLSKALIYGLPRCIGIIFIVSVIMVLSKRLDREIPVLAKSFFIAAIGAYLSAVWQSKGWAYHVMPGNMLLALSGMIVLLSWLGTEIKRQWPIVLLAVLAVIINVPTRDHIVDHITDAKGVRTVAGLTDLMTGLGQDKTVFAFNTSPRNVMPAVINADAQWSGKACCLHFVPSAVRFGSAENKRVAKVQVDEIFASLLARPPQLLIVDDSEKKLGFDGQEFDYFDYLGSQYPVKLESLFSQYREIEAVEDYRVFRLKDAQNDR